MEVTEFLGYFCILACGLSKLPQIWRVHQTQAVAGISVPSILLELYNHGVQTGFYLSQSYPWTQYLEYPLLVSQNFLLLLLLGLATSSIPFSTATIAVITAVIAAMGQGAVPKDVILMGLSLTIPLGLSSKLAQISAVRGEGSSDNVSIVPWAVNGVTGLARFYTHMNSQVPPEPLVLFNSVSMILANTAVCATIVLYRGGKVKSS